MARLPPRTEAYLVGGAVRDLLLGRPLVDLDLAVPRGAVALARRLADGLGAAFVALDEERGVARIVWEREGRRLEVDVADFRAADLAGDLCARDLTINALAMPLNGAHGGATPPEIVDPAGGRQDLRDGVVRLLSPAVLRDDPLRTMRAVRVAAQLGFRLDERSAEWIAEAAPLLVTAAPERVRDELWKCVVAPAPASTLRRLDELGLLALVLPETVPAHGMAQSPPHREDVWQHSLSVVEQTAAVIALVQRLAAGAPAGDADAVLVAGLTPFAAPLAERLARPLAAERSARGHLLLAALFHDLGKPLDGDRRRGRPHPLLRPRAGGRAPGGGASRRAALRADRGAAGEPHRAPPHAAAAAAARDGAVAAVAAPLPPRHRRRGARGLPAVARRQPRQGGRARARRLARASWRASRSCSTPSSSATTRWWRRRRCCAAATW